MMAGGIIEKYDQCPSIALALDRRGRIYYFLIRGPGPSGVLFTSS
jgi:hypothetical protein